MSDFEIALTTISKLWPIFITMVLVIAWFIRLEARQYYHEKDFERFRESAKSNEDKLWENINEIKNQNTKILQSLSRMEGKFERS